METKTYKRIAAIGIILILAVTPFITRYFRGNISKQNVVYDLESFKNYYLEESNTIKPKTKDDSFVFPPVQPEEINSSDKVHAVLLSDTPEAKLIFLLEGFLKVLQPPSNLEKTSKYGLMFEDSLKSTKSLCVLNNERQIPDYYNMEILEQYTLKDEGLPVFQKRSEKVNGQTLKNTLYDANPAYYILDGKKVGDKWVIKNEVSSDAPDEVKQNPPTAEIQIEKRVEFNGIDAVLLNIKTKGFSVVEPSGTSMKLTAFTTTNGKLYVAEKTGNVLWSEMEIKITEPKELASTQILRFLRSIN
ncbi:MAG: hypothetical protein LBJ67_01345 [Planctomycetaceae bacterium]|jgi:hypothetical protein|nr:hypothetical protein [Planctomycetaceae bacterium]